MAEFTTPVGRLVYGSPTRRNPVTDNHGKPVMQADGVTPATELSFGVAIPKQGEQFFQQTEWGAKIYEAVKSGWQRGEEQRPDFSWKVTDGDSNIPNKKGNIPCQKEGYAGHWVINFSTRLNVKLYDYIHSQGGEIFEDGTIQTGHYIQVYATAEPNNKNNPNVQTPGVYLNPVYVAHSAYGPVIQTTSGPDVGTVGFGGGQLPPGATTTPQGGNGGFNPAGQQPQQAQQGQQGGYNPNGQQPQQAQQGQQGGYNPNGQQAQQGQQGGYNSAAPQGGNGGYNPNGQQAPNGTPAHGVNPQNAAQSAPQQGYNAQGASSVQQGNGAPNHSFANGGQ